MDKLKVIKNQMNILAIRYEFMRYTQNPIYYPYYVGEITSPEQFGEEDGSEETTLILTGFHNGDYIDLERDKDKIKKHFDPIFGFRAKTDSGAIAIFYEGAFYVPTGEANLKKIQINLKIKEWKGVK